MRRIKRPTKNVFTDREIGRFVRLLRKLLRVHDQKTSNILVFFEHLKKIFPRLRLRIVENADLPDSEARAYPASWIIKISRGVYEGLLRGDTRARWTFAHELGHILLQHRGKPFRKKSETGLKTVEQEAHLFAAQLLAPSDLAKTFKSAAEIASAFQISIDAAHRRIKELKLEGKGKKIGNRKSSALLKQDTFQLEEYAETLYQTISAAFSETTSPTILEPWQGSAFNASLLISKGAELLFEAYSSVRPNSKSDFVRAACMALSLFTVYPIREIGVAKVDSKHLRALNELCALRSVQSLLQLEPADLESIVCNNSLCNNEFLVPSDYLTSLVKLGAAIAIDASSVLHFNRLPSYYDYNGNCDISWREIRILENLAKIFALWATEHSLRLPCGIDAAGCK